jgi:predicted CoA-binding protein
MLGKVDGMATINDARLREILAGSPTVAVLGIHREPEKAAFYVPEYLHDEGYRVIGVNPEFKDETLFGEKVRSTLKEIGEPIDIVDVFRRPMAAGEAVDEAIAVGAKAVWLQLGVVNEEAAARAEAAGLKVVMDRCIKVDVMRLGIPRIEESSEISGT